MYSIDRVQPVDVYSAAHIFEAPPLRWSRLLDDDTEEKTMPRSIIPPRGYTSNWWARVNTAAGLGRRSAGTLA